MEKYDIHDEYYCIALFEIFQDKLGNIYNRHETLS